MKINTSNKKKGVIQNKNLFIHVYNTTLQQVMIQCNGKDDVELKCRIASAKETFDNMEKILKDRKKSIRLRLRIFHYSVWSVIRYAFKT